MAQDNDPCAMPASNCYMGKWLAYDVNCTKYGCLNNRESRRASTPSDRLPRVSVFWAGQTRPIDGHYRSLIELQLPMAHVGIYIDGCHRTSDAAKPEPGYCFNERECRVVSGRLPQWLGRNCPLCMTALDMMPNSWDESTQNLLLRQKPHLCVTSVDSSVTPGRVLVRLDSPTWLDFHLTLELPSNVLPQPMDPQ